MGPGHSSEGFSTQVCFLIDLCVEVIMKNRVISAFFEVINPSTTSMCPVIYYSVYMRTSGKKVRISDEAERVQSVSYSHVRSLSGLYTLYSGVFKGRQVRHLPRAPPCNCNAQSSIPCFQMRPNSNCNV